MPKLSVRKVETIKKPGMYGDGEGLYLRVGPTGGKSWILRTVVHGRRRDLGLGSASLTALAEARVKARKLRKVAREGGDPDTVKRRETLTFEEAAQKVYANLMPTWRSEGHGSRWLSSLRRYAFPTFGHRPIDTISNADVLNVLTPIWSEKHDTARRVKQRISSVFDWAKGAGHYPHENPVNGLKKALPPITHRAQHMPALPWKELPDLMLELSERDGTSARCLEFIILTAARSREATFAAGNLGKPQGARHRATKAVLELLDGEAEALTRKAVEQALDGDTSALRLCLERIAPPRKDVPVQFNLPPMTSAHDASEAAQAILGAVSAGDLTPLEGASVMGLVEQYRRTLELTDFEKRIEALEAGK